MTKTKIIVLSTIGGIVLIAGVVLAVSFGLFGENRTALVAQYRAEHAENYDKGQTVSIGQVDVKVIDVSPYELKQEDSFGEEVPNTKYIAVTVEVQPNNDVVSDKLFAEIEIEDALGVGYGTGPKIPWESASYFDQTWALNQEELQDAFKGKSIIDQPAELTYIFRIPADLQNPQLVYTLSTYERSYPIIGTEGVPQVSFTFRIALDL